MTTFTTKQKILVLLCTLIGVVAIVLTTVFATVAYLTSSAAVSNVFTIGNVSMTLTESKVNPDGTKTDDGATQVDTNTYHLVPSTTYAKDPRVNISAGSEHSYLFALVRNDIEAIEDRTVGTDNKTIAQQLAENGWARYIKAATGWVYIYVGVGNVPAGDENITDASYKFVGTDANSDGKPDVALAEDGASYYLFHNFSIGNVDSAELNKYGAAKITITAVAIQDTNEFDNGVHDAWEAVVDTYPYIHTGN